MIVLTVNIVVAVTIWLIAVCCIFRYWRCHKVCHCRCMLSTCLCWPISTMITYCYCCCCCCYHYSFNPFSFLLMKSHPHCCCCCPFSQQHWRCFGWPSWSCPNIGGNLTTSHSLCYVVKNCCCKTDSMTLAWCVVICCSFISLSFYLGQFIC